MTTPDPIARLEQIVAAVEADLRHTERLAVRYGTPGLPVAPELARDTNGRYLLLDAYTALVTARAARDTLDAHLLDLPDDQRHRFEQQRNARDAAVQDLRAKLANVQALRDRLAAPGSHPDAIDYGPTISRAVVAQRLDAALGITHHEPPVPVLPDPSRRPETRGV